MELTLNWTVKPKAQRGWFKERGDGEHAFCYKHEIQVCRDICRSKVNRGDRYCGKCARSEVNVAAG